MDFSSPEQVAKVRAALALKADTKIVAEGTVTFAAVPAMAGHYADKCARIFAQLGCPFTESEQDRLQEALRRQLDVAYSGSQRSSITVRYTTSPDKGIEYGVGFTILTIEEAYDEWISTREPPLFGTEPDARVMALSEAVGDPSRCRVLDIGAGTGRNGLPLARRGHPVDAVELSAQFADGMRSAAQRDGLDLTVIQRDVLDPEAELRHDYSLIVASEVVPEFRDPGDLRKLFELADRILLSGGVLVFNAFLAHKSYDPDDAAREFAQQAYSAFFTWDELASAASGLRLELADEERALDYEKSHLPEGAWPPTKWYPYWSSGVDIFGLSAGECPVDLRWLVYRKI